MDPFDAMRSSRPPNHVALCHNVTRGHGDSGQIGEGHLESGDRLDGDRLHACHVAGESDAAWCRSPHRGPGGHRIVDPPMTSIGPDGCEPGDHRPFDRGSEANRSYQQRQKHPQSLSCPNLSVFV
jgi:hypothetical protein